MARVVGWVCTLRGRCNRGMDFSGVCVGGIVVWICCDGAARWIDVAGASRCKRNRY